MGGGRVVPDVLAAVDLGSNSFHMVVARHQHGQLVILDRLREMVRLGAGLSDSGRLDEEAMARALRCLERFGQRLRAMRADSVRVVGTNALRLVEKNVPHDPDNVPASFLRRHIAFDAVCVQDQAYFVAISNR